MTPLSPSMVTSQPEMLKKTLLSIYKYFLSIIYLNKVNYLSLTQNGCPVDYRVTRLLQSSKTIYVILNYHLAI